MSLQRAFVIHAGDNVATALEDLSVGAVMLLGECRQRTQSIHQAIKVGHKFALKSFNAGDPVVKYGVIIGEARRSCQVGEWMHLHNMRSRYDKRSNTFDVDSGAPTEEDVYR